MVSFVTSELATSDDRNDTPPTPSARPSAAVAELSVRLPRVLMRVLQTAHSRMRC